MGKRRFTAEERIKIVELYIRNGIGYGPISKKYDVPETTLHHWVRKYNEKGAEGLLDNKRKPESEMTELEKLRAENRMLEARNKRLELECALLKKLEEIEGRWR